MSVIRSARLCDSIEIACIQLKKKLSNTDIFKEIKISNPDCDDEELSLQISEAFQLAKTRSICAGALYPFEITNLTIELKNDLSVLNPYLFQMLGVAIKNLDLAKAKTHTKNFQKYFEDLVSWAFSRSIHSTAILSMPRQERGFPTSLKATLGRIANRDGLKTKFLKHKVLSTDKDLGVDILLFNQMASDGRSGKPLFLVQCATGPYTQLQTKLTENPNNFHSVWEGGFYSGCSIRCIATPDDLLPLPDLQWERLSKDGWVLDRTRISKIFSENDGNVPSNLVNLNKHWNDTLKLVAKLDWQNYWSRVR